MIPVVPVILLLGFGAPHQAVESTAGLQGLLLEPQVRGSCAQTKPVM